MSGKQIQQIYQYIQANGSFLTSQKVLKQVQKHPQMVWQLIVKLCAKLKNKNIQNAYAQMVYMLSQPEKHQRSAKWLKEYMDIRDLALKLNTTYTVLDYIKPEKDKIINLILKIIDVSKGVNSLKSQLDSLIVKDELTTKELTKYKALQENTRNSLHQITQRKKSQRAIYEEKVQTIERIHEQINFKRQQKFELISKQKFLKQQINKDQKIVEDFRYENQNRLIRIQQLKKEIAQNAPQVKKEKRAIEDEYHRLQKEVHAELQLSRMRQNKIISCLQSRRKYKGLIIDQVNKLIQVFSILDQSKAKYSKLKDDNQNFKRRKNQQFAIESNCKDQLHSLEIQFRNNIAANDNIIRQRQKLQMRCRELMAEVTRVKDGIRDQKDKNFRIQQLQSGLSEKIRDQKRKFEFESNQLKEELRKWKETVTRKAKAIYGPLFEIKYMCDRQNRQSWFQE